jgi:hypothetical protein
MTDSAVDVDPIVASFQKSDIRVIRTEVRTYPDETTVLVYVREPDFVRAVEVSQVVESTVQSESRNDTFLVVRKVTSAEAVSDTNPITSIQDPRVDELVRLISAKSRVSSVEPNLIYVPDARASLSVITASRHHLVFGRRGAGKSALLMQARSQVLSEGATISWTNVQSLRNQTAQDVFLWIIEDLLGAVIGARQAVSSRSAASLGLSEVYEQVRSLAHSGQSTIADAQRLVPRIQRALSRFLELEGTRVFCFVDDFYYVSRDVQPVILDMLHGSTREANVWLKVASIRHLTNWWQSSPPTGLQSGQDAELIDLDVTLQDPEKASAFLEGILSEYGQRVGLSSLSRIFHRSALDRLVLASGAVPRDYMVLAVNSIARAKRRANSRLTGVQDVNQAAGDAASSKIQELEEDMAANSGDAERTLGSLRTVRTFCLDEESFTYFLVAYRDKEQNPALYSRLTDLMDVRLIHLVDAGVSDAHEAGLRFEAYMLDLSQFSGSRLKQRITVLDFEDGHFVSKQTRSKTPSQRGGSSLQMIAILRRGPVLDLQRLSE